MVKKKEKIEIDWFFLGGSVVMQIFVLYVPFLQYIFETVPLTLPELVYSTLVASVVLILDELWKRVSIRKKNQ